MWTTDDKYTAVAYEWHDPRTSFAGSAYTLAMFHYVYRQADQDTEPIEDDTRPGSGTRAASSCSATGAAPSTAPR